MYSADLPTPSFGEETKGDSPSVSIPVKTPSTESKRAQPLTVTLNGSAITLCFAAQAKETFWVQS
jgi:hypothetical protein